MANPLGPDCPNPMCRHGPDHNCANPKHQEEGTTMSEQHPGKMKLQITMPMLERMLGGDTEMEMELRNGIANEFADKHLKSMATEITDGYSASIARQVSEAFEEKIYSEFYEMEATGPGAYFRRPVLSERGKELVSAQAHDVYLETVRGVAEKVLEEKNIDDQLDRLITARMNEVVRKKLNSTVVQENLDAIIQQRVEQHAASILTNALRKLGVEETKESE